MSRIQRGFVASALVLASASLGLSGLSGCEEPAPALPDCSLIGCTDLLVIAIVGLEANQTYEIVADTGADLVTCSVDTSDGLRMDCGSSLLISARLDEARIEVVGQPQGVTVVASQDGAEIARESFAPDYVDVAPNGEECGPICAQAEVSFEL